MLSGFFKTNGDCFDSICINIFSYRVCSLRCMGLLCPSAPISLLFGIWGSSATDVFAVGRRGTILHYNGSNWSPMTSGTTTDLVDVWGSSSNDVFAVGDNWDHFAL